MSNYPIHLKWRKARRISSLPCSFYIRKNCGQCISNDTRRFVDIEASSLSQHGRGSRKRITFSEWFQNRDIYIPRDTIPGMFFIVRVVRRPTRNLCIVALVSFLIFFNSVTNDQEAREGKSLSVYFLKRRFFIVRYFASDAIFYRFCFDSPLDRVNVNYLWNFLRGG